jgi:hypothetical protein
MGSRLLLVEGSDDLHVMSALCGAHNIPEVFRIEVSGGIDRLLESVPLRLRIESDLERLGVVMDADQDLQVRWFQLRDRLRHAGFTLVPDLPAANGTVVELGGGRRFGVWIMPNNEVPGILESFLAFLIDANDSMLPMVDAFLRTIPPNSRRFPLALEPKARLHAFLSVQETPGKPLGQSITARYLDARVPVVAPVIGWLRLTLVD